MKQVKDKSTKDRYSFEYSYRLRKHSDNCYYRDILKNTIQNNHNVEQLSAKLLFDLTRNTGFEVSKGNIGECWIKSCCGWNNRQDNDICGLDENHLSVTEKMKNIFNGTSLHSEFSNLGLEVMV